MAWWFSMAMIGYVNFYQRVNLAFFPRRLHKIVKLWAQDSKYAEEHLTSDRSWCPRNFLHTYRLAPLRCSECPHLTYELCGQAVWIFVAPTCSMVPAYLSCIYLRNHHQSPKCRWIFHTWSIWAFCWVGFVYLCIKENVSYHHMFFPIYQFIASCIPRMPTFGVYKLRTRSVAHGEMPPPNGKWRTAQPCYFGAVSCI